MRGWSKRPLPFGRSDKAIREKVVLASEYWITLQIDPQRTRDIRVAGDSYTEVVKKYKKSDGYKVIAVRPCDRSESAEG